MIVVLPATTKADCIAIQSVFNHPDVIGYLGGFCILDTLLGKMRQSGCTLWQALYDNKVVGGFVIAGRSQCHQAKFGEVGVLPDYRRMRIGTCLYAAGLFQSVLEGRRLMEDTIVGDNPFQFNALSALRVPQIGILPMKTASFKDIALFCLNVNEAAVNHFLWRMPEDCQVAIEHTSYTADLWEKNKAIYLKKNPAFVTTITACRDIVEKDTRMSILQGPEVPPTNKGKQRASNRQDTFL